MRTKYVDLYSGSTSDEALHRGSSGKKSREQKYYHIHTGNLGLFSVSTKYINIDRFINDITLCYFNDLKSRSSKKSKIYFEQLISISVL